jgi:hypothetical protein
MLSLPPLTLMLPPILPPETMMVSVPKPVTRLPMMVPAGHVEHVVVEFHVDPADAATGHTGGIAVLEGASNGATGHQEEVAAVALRKETERAAGHHEIINAGALVDGSGNDTGCNVGTVCPCTEGHTAIDLAGAVDGEGETVVACQISQ